MSGWNKFGTLGVAMIFGCPPEYNKKIRGNIFQSQKMERGGEILLEYPTVHWPLPVPVQEISDQNITCFCVHADFEGV